MVDFKPVKYIRFETIYDKPSVLQLRKAEVYGKE